MRGYEDVNDGFLLLDEIELDTLFVCEGRGV